jgi:putative oxidoreductase
MMKSFSHRACSPGFGLFLIRVALAVVFLVHGVMKLSNMDGTIGFFASLGMGAFWAWAVAIVETVGGALMLLGVWTTLTGIALAVIMLVSIFAVKWSMGYLAFELDFVLLLAALAVATSGAGKLSLGNRCGCGCKMCKVDCHDGAGTCDCACGTCKTGK